MCLVWEQFLRRNVGRSRLPTVERKREMRKLQRI